MVDPPLVVGPNGCDETERRVVRKFNGLDIIPEFRDRKDGPEDFLTPDVAVAADIIEYCRLHEVAPFGKCQENSGLH